MAVAAAPEPQANMGQPEPRVDARQKVTGEARYASDFPLANPAYAVLVTGAIAKGRLLGLDLEDAKRHYGYTMGLMPALEEPGRVFYKGWDEWDHHSLVLEEGGVGLA